MAALQEQLDWKYPNDEEEIELEGAKKLVEILPKIITSLMPIKMGNNPQQKEWPFGDISPTLPYETQINQPMTSMSAFELEILWQKATKRFGFLKEEPENNIKLAERLWDINHSRWEHYLEHHDELMIQAYRRELDMLKKHGN